jgi:acyl-CoA thioester hydrolase
MVPYDLAAGRPRRLTDAERAFLARWADTPDDEPAPGRDNGSSAAEPAAEDGPGSVDRSMGARRAAAALRPPGSG